MDISLIIVRVQLVYQPVYDLSLNGKTYFK